MYLYREETKKRSDLMFTRKKPDTKNKKMSTYNQKVTKNDFDSLEKIPISSSLEENYTAIKEILLDCSDLVYRQFSISPSKVKALIIYIDCLVDKALIDQNLFRSLLKGEQEIIKTEDLQESSLNASDLSTIDNLGILIKKLLQGNTILLVDQDEKGISVEYSHTENRSISEPETEIGIRGPREGFTEKISINLSLIRRRLKSPRLKTKSLVLGSETQTSVVITYLKGIAKDEMIEEVLARIHKIEIDGILESGAIEELIKDNAWSVFPQILDTERPDKVVAGLLEGRAAIIVDGTPFVLIVPSTFWTMMQASDDYYENWIFSSVIRLLRIGLLFIALLTPALYIALTTFHIEMVPTNLLFSIAASREPIPFPAVLESLIMELTFEALREAGVRMPKNIGQTISILGALVIGTAAVEAGIVSAIVVIVVSITGIASFTIPQFTLSNTFRFLRFPFMILASIFGLYGIFLGLTILLGHLCQLRSFGIPYFLPINTLQNHEWNDVLIRSPIWKNIKRPSDISQINDDRFVSAEKEQT
jgi:spore germination protein